ncbi:MAG: hypothetical protein WAU33_07535 [Candidatus Binataceae bacterium]
MSKINPILFLTVVVFLCFSAGQSYAAIWCGHGPGSALDHPCTASDVPNDSAASGVVAKHETQWWKIKGVWEMGYSTSAAGGGTEIQISADPPWAACVRSQIPASVDSIPVVAIPISAPTGVITNGNHFAMYGKPPAYEVSNGASDREKDYSRIVQKYGHQWMGLAGVIGVAPAGCDCGSCDFTGIEISVQRHFMSALLKQIPPSVDGVPVTLLPND